MTNEGFICISRGIRAHWVWKNPVYFKRWAELIMMANYDNREVSFSCHRLMLQRGQLAVNLSSNMGSLFKLSYDVELRGDASEKGFIDELRCRNANLEISLHRRESSIGEL